MSKEVVEFQDALLAASVTARAKRASFDTIFVIEKLDRHGKMVEDKKVKAFSAIDVAHRYFGRRIKLYTHGPALVDVKDEHGALIGRVVRQDEEVTFHR